MDEEKLTKREFFKAAIIGTAIGQGIDQLALYLKKEQKAKIQLLVKESVGSSISRYIDIFFNINQILDGLRDDSGKLYDARSARAETIKLMAEELNKGPSEYLFEKQSLLNRYDNALPVPTEMIVTRALQEGSFQELDRFLPDTSRLSPRFCLNATKILLALPAAQDADLDIYRRIVSKLERHLADDDHAELVRILADKARSLKSELRRLNDGNSSERKGGQVKKDSLADTLIFNQMRTLNRIAEIHAIPALFDMDKVKTAAPDLPAR